MCCAVGCSEDLFLGGKERGWTQETDAGIPGHKGSCGRAESWLARAGLVFQPLNSHEYD